MVAGYSFTSPDIAAALVNAKAHGVDVHVVLDKSQRTEKYTGATYLVNHGVPVLINSHYKIMHHKFMVFDSDRTLFGSFNFTKAAESGNAENVNLFKGNTKLADLYAAEWGKLAEESEPYSRR